MCYAFCAWRMLLAYIMVAPHMRMMHVRDGAFDAVYSSILVTSPIDGVSLSVNCPCIPLLGFEARRSLLGLLDDLIQPLEVLGFFLRQTHPVAFLGGRTRPRSLSIRDLVHVQKSPILCGAIQVFYQAIGAVVDTSLSTQLSTEFPTTAPIDT